MKLVKNLATLCVLFGVLFAGSAYAVTPANSILKNTAKLTYAGNATGILASVDVKVQLKPVAPAVIGGNLATPISKSEGTEYKETFKIKAQGNGKDIYNLNATATATGVTGNSAGQLLIKTGPGTTAAGPVTLGATALSVAAPGGSATITVPSDDATDASVNGLEVGDTVDIGGTEYLITAITDGGPGGTSSITVDSNVPVQPIGTGIFEVVELEVSVPNVGTISGAAPNQVSLAISVSSQADGAQAYNHTVVINVVKVLFNKYVRNVTTPTLGPACTGPIIYEGSTFCASGVEALPGETLEYYLKIDASAADVTTAQVTDVLDEFTEYLNTSGGTTKLNNITVDANVTGGPFPLTAGLNVDSATSRTVNTVGGGTIVATESAHVVYQAKVKN